MGMLYEGLNDIEGLQDRMTKMIGSLGHFDKETGEVKVSAFDKRRLRAYADATGQDYSSIMESVHNMAKRSEIERQMNTSVAAGKFDAEMKELIMNTGVIKDGKAGVNIKGKFKTIDEITERDRDHLRTLTQTQSEDIKQIAMDLRSLVQKEEGLGKQFDAIQGEIASPFGRLLKWTHKIFDTLVFGVGLLGVIAAFKGGGLIGGSFANLLGKKGALMRFFNASTSGAGNAIKGVGNMFKFGSTTAGKGAASGIFKYGVERGGQRALIKIGGKELAKKGLIGMSTKGSANLISTGAGMSKAALGGIGSVAAIGGMVGNYFTDKAVAEGKMEKGGTGHHWAKIGSQALAWGGSLAAIGSFAGPLGTAIGAAVGAVIGGTIGAIQAGKAKNEVIIDNQLKELGIERKGDYTRRQLKKFDEALHTGEISNRMRRKLIQKGDTAILKEIEKKKEKNEAKELKKEAIKAKNKMKFGVANISVGVANFKGRGFGGGHNLLDSLKVVGGVITKGSEVIKGYKEDGFNGAVEALKKSNKDTATENKEPKTFNINMSGTLKLTQDDGQSIDIINHLKNNPTMLRKLADMISREIEYLEYGAYLK